MDQEERTNKSQKYKIKKKNKLTLKELKYAKK